MSARTCKMPAEPCWKVPTVCVALMSNVEAESAAGRQGGRYMLYAGGAALTGAAVLVISASLFMHPEPVTEEEAERLAADARRRRVTSITPYAEPGGGGLVIAGRF